MASTRILFFFLFLIYPLSQVSAQTNVVKPPVVKSASAQDAAISKIRKAYNQINALTLKKEKFNYEANGCVEEGVVT